MSDNAKRLFALFRGFEGAHGTYSAPEKEIKPTGIKWGIKNSARTKREPPTVELFVKHLAGEYPLGIIPITEQGGCWWGGIDVDDYSINPLVVIQKIESAKLPLVPVTSKSNGLHLFMFMQKPEQAALVQSVLQNLAARLGLSSSEIFPKQTKVIAEKGDVGNWLCLPWLGTTFDGKLSEQTGIKKTGARQTLEEFLNFAEGHKVSHDTLLSLDDGAPKPKPSPPSPGGGGTEGGDPFSDGPPCLVHLAEQGVPDGGRNSTLFMMALYYVRKYGLEGPWKAKLEEANRLFFNPPLDASEVSGIINSVVKKAPEGEDGYKYTCKTQPMASHCQSKLCRGRRFGIGNAEQTPKISGVSKLASEPVLWFINVGDIRIECTTQQFQQFMMFHALCMDKLNVSFNFIKQADWMTMVGEAMSHEVTIIDVPPEVSILGHFKELLEEFCTDRQIADDKEELLRSLPWKGVDEQRVYFKLSALQTFLDRQNFKHYNRTKLTQKIKELGGGDQFFNLKNRGVNVWYVPLSLFSPPPAYSIPPIEQGPI